MPADDRIYWEISSIFFTVPPASVNQANQFSLVDYGELMMTPLTPKLILQYKHEYDSIDYFCFYNMSSEYFFNVSDSTAEEIHHSRTEVHTVPTIWLEMSRYILSVVVLIDKCCQKENFINLALNIKTSTKDKIVITNISL